LTPSENSSLPESVWRENVSIPQAEDLALDVLRRRLPGLTFTSLIEQEIPPPFVLVRAVSFYGAYTADTRFIRDYFISAESFTKGLESDVDGPPIHIAIENAFKRAALASDPVLDGAGWIEGAELVDPARRVADWANSEGPVQYADLPQGWARFISTHRIKFKRAVIGPHIYDH